MVTLDKYGTIRRGKIKVKLGSQQHKLLLARKLPFSVVTIQPGRKIIKRVNVPKPSVSYIPNHLRSGRKVRRHKRATTWRKALARKRVREGYFV